ncbi:hypothetical protein S100390_v1c05620 [Spiroplasma sp. NBRC 100390]|uniref:hypothetical protein n=1 Tax=unclassified Spiroplasma TaxID=2637901 RepID=UPI0008928AD7|nr:MULTISPECIES: hypothetical protein [unclassified Spiroplasma]AOX43899.1 hypothetical protein STU14_v1c05620 [Spiroplasma sp. TU-14]APE13369.1 hypothetical protein S100390_v1c05620 [Spiroplasma sp. NBRC 100390]
MKKLLILFGVTLIPTAATTSIISCIPNPNLNEDKADSPVNDLEVFNEIIQTAQKSFESALFQEAILGNNPDLLKAYQWVDKTNNPKLTLQFNNLDHRYVINHFLTIFRAVFDNVNRQIVNQYPNYYPNSQPLMFQEIDHNITLQFVDINEINTRLGLQINGIENLKIVNIQFMVWYQVQFKGLTARQPYQTNFNMTNDLALFNKLNDKAILQFQDYLLQWISNIEIIELTENKLFKPLYDEFNIDFTNNNTALDQNYKIMLKDFIQGHQRLNHIDISYNEEKNFVNTINTLFNNRNDKGYYYNNRVNWENSRLYHWGGQNIETANVNNFVQQYKQRIAPKLNEITNQTLTLAKATLNLDYLNVYGMTLKGIVKNNKNMTFETTITLSEVALDQKLTNFANLIIAFLRFYNLNSDGTWFNFMVDETTFKQILTNGLSNFQLPKTLFNIFINSEKDKKILDLNLFNYQQVTGWYNTDWNYNGIDRIFANGGGYDGTFTFGKAVFHYTPFYHYGDKTTVQKK